MKPTRSFIKSKSSIQWGDDRCRQILNGFRLILINLFGVAAASGDMTDAKQTPPTDQMTPAAQVAQVVEWQPGDPLSFDNGLGTFDVQIRERAEVRDNWIDFDSKTNTRDDTGLLQRLRLGLLVVPSDWVTLYAQMEDSRTLFSDPNTSEPNKPGSQRTFVTNDDPLSLRQAYIQFNKAFDHPLSFQFGRQILSYGDQRLIGAFDWDNNARVFDAVKMRYQTRDYTVDAFAAYPVPHQSQDFDVPATHDLFTGVYATTMLVPNMTSDYYVLWRSKSQVAPVTSFTNTNNQSEGDPTPDGDYATLGTRWKSAPNAFSGWDFGGEGAFQVGTIINPQGGTATTVSHQTIDTGRQDLIAGMAHAEVGYTVECDWTPRFFASFDYGSGSGNPNSGTSNTFQNLFPTNHPLYGIMDRFSLQNMYQATVGVITKPTDKLSIRLDYHNTWLVSTEDEWRYSNQTPVGPTAISPLGTSTGTGGYAPRYAKALLINPSNYMGSEVDLIATYDVTKWCKLQVGGAHFFAGDYIRETASSQETDDANFVYTQMQFDF